MAVASLILGIVGIVLSCIPSVLCTYFGWIGALLGLVGLILSILCKKKPETNNGLATGGLVTGIIAVVLGLILFFTCGLPVARLSSAINEAAEGITDINLDDIDLDALEDLESLFE